MAVFTVRHLRRYCRSVVNDHAASGLSAGLAAGLSASGLGTSLEDVGESLGESGASRWNSDTKRYLPLQVSSVRLYACKSYNLWFDLGRPAGDRLFVQCNSHDDVIAGVLVKVAVELIGVVLSSRLPPEALEQLLRRVEMEAESFPPATGQDSELDTSQGECSYYRQWSLSFSAFLLRVSLALSTCRDHPVTAA